MSNHEELIASLSGDLQSVSPVVSVDRVAAAWLLVCAAYVVGVTHLLGPVRPNALSQLLTEPRFFIETLMGVLAISVGAVVAFRSSIPGALRPGQALAAAALMAAWLSFYVVGLASPALEPSMLGKRDYCVWETLVYALPPMLLGFYLTRRLYPLQPVWTAMTLSLMAGMLPALYMQVACMYVPSHILKFHIMPGFVVALLGMGIAWIAQRRRLGSSPIQK
jgi:hypothetical protein